MRLVLAEKPKVAKAMKAAIPSGGGVYITCLFGHMLELAEPGEYDERWKKWSPDALPIRVDDWKLNPHRDKRQRLSEIKRLLKEATEVIHVGDPDREGQLLVEEVLDHFGYHGPVKRMLANATDPKNIRKAWANLQPNERFRGMRLSAECRQRADWLVGMNLTRAVTRLLGHGGLVSIGRVQTPTLALVVRRDKTIRDFRPESFFTFRARFTGADSKVLEMKCEPKPRVFDERLARDAAAAVSGNGVIARVIKSEKSHMSPLPFHLGTFQSAAERHFGWTLKQALEGAQAAYDAGLTSYPRVDCPYLPGEQADEALTIAQAIVDAMDVSCGTSLMQAKPRVYDSSKVKVHHGIIPTGEIPTHETPANARKAWELISAHFLRTLLPDETYEETEIRVDAEALADREPKMLRFIRKGERVTNAKENWRIVDVDKLVPPVKAKAPRRQEALLPIPALADGEMLTCTECVRKRGKTTPPKHYTETSLREDMDAVGKYVTDERLKKVLKETSGIGTPATQAAIVETLKKRGYIKIERGKVLATASGIAIIETIPPALADPGVTAAWEEALAEIEAGTYEPKQFMERVDKMIERHLAKIRAMNAQGKRIAGTERDAERSTKPTRKKKANTKSRTNSERHKRQRPHKSGGGNDDAWL